MDFYKGPSFDWQVHPRIFVFCVFFVWSFNGFYYRLDVWCVFFNDILNRIDNSCIVCFIVFFMYYIIETLLYNIVETGLKLSSSKN